MIPHKPAVGNGRCVVVRHLACVTSMTWIASLQTVAEPSDGLRDAGVRRQAAQRVCILATWARLLVQGAEGSNGIDGETVAVGISLLGACSYPSNRHAY